MAFVRLTRHLNHAGSAYALVGATVGPRAGFFSGFAMLGTYIGFSVGTLALSGAFANALLAELQGGSPHPTQIPWPIAIGVGAVLSFFLAGREAAMIAKVLLVIEGAGIIAMVILAAVIFAKGGAPGTGIDLTVFTLDGAAAAQVLSGVVAAFLSWAGFEACASLGEETESPGRNIPRALAGTLILTGVLFTVLMAAQTIGFGTDSNGLARMQRSANTLGDLGHDYIGLGFSLIVDVTAICASFGCHVASAATAGRMLFAFARDGIGPSALSVLDAKTNGPRRASTAVVAIALIACVVCAATGWPVEGTGNPAIDTYFLFAMAGAVCLMVAYLMVEIAAVRFVLHKKFQKVHGGRARAAGTVLPALGALVIAVVLWFSAKDAAGPVDAPLLGLYWCVLGLLLAVAASRSTARVGVSLAKELRLEESTEEADPLEGSFS